LMVSDKIASAVIAALPDLLKALAALKDLLTKSGATDEQIREALEPAERAEIERISDRLEDDERRESDLFGSAAKLDSAETSTEVADPLGADGNQSSDGSGSLRA
jgi:hypothetical protein